MLLSIPLNFWAEFSWVVLPASVCVCTCTQSCLTLDCSPRFLCPRNFPGKNIRVGSNFLISDPWIEPVSLVSPALAGRFFTTVHLRLVCGGLTNVWVSFWVGGMVVGPGDFAGTSLPGLHVVLYPLVDSSGSLSWRWWLSKGNEGMQGLLKLWSRIATLSASVILYCSKQITRPA